MAVPWPSGRLWDSQLLSHGHPDAHGQPISLPKAIRMPMGQSMSLPMAIRTPMGRYVTHLGQLWMTMGMRTGMGRTPLELNRSSHFCFASNDGTLLCDNRDLLKQRMACQTIKNNNEFHSQQEYF